MREGVIRTSGKRCFWQRPQHVQRPGGSTVPGVLEEHRGGPCVWRGRRGRVPPKWYLLQAQPKAHVSEAPHLLLLPFLVLLQAPDLLQQAAPLLSQPHDLLIGILIILSPDPGNPPPLHDAQGLYPPVPEPELSPHPAWSPFMPPPKARASLTGIGILAGG